MSKYAPLTVYLEARKGRKVRVTFDELEEILGFTLPNSKKVRAWWSNNPWNNVMTKAWLAAGYKTANVDVAGGILSFVPSDGAGTKGFAEMNQESFQPPKPKAEEHGSSNTHAASEERPHPLWGIWEGKVTLLPDYDYTQPADPDWGKVYDE